MSKETLEEFLARGGKVNKIDAKEYSQDMRSDYSSRDHIDVVQKNKKNSLGAQKMFNGFAEAMTDRFNNNWKWQK